MGITNSDLIGADYYITYFVARRAGFSEQDAYILAYSSQDTDGNTTEYVISPDTSSQYHVYIGQTYDILKAQEERLRIYPVFHFMPSSSTELLADYARRKDGRTHLLNTIPEKRNARLRLTDALGTEISTVSALPHTSIPTRLLIKTLSATRTTSRISGDLSGQSFPVSATPTPEISRIY